MRESGAVRIGYRPDAAPFSFQRGGAEPHGYSIELCRVIVEEMAAATGGRPLAIAFRPVTPESRIADVAAGAVDLECGATSITAERRTRVSFSPPIFISGTRLAVSRGSGIRSHRDLQGRALALAAGTTTETVLREALHVAGVEARLTTTADVDEAMRLLASGRVDAAASDDILLRGYVAQTGAHGRIAIVGRLLSYETYGIAYAREDPAMDAAVQAAFRRVAATGELRWIYNKWFLRPLPDGTRLGVPMGVELQRTFEMLGLPPG